MISINVAIITNTKCLPIIATQLSLPIGIRYTILHTLSCTSIIYGLFKAQDSVVSLGMVELNIGCCEILNFGGLKG